MVLWPAIQTSVQDLDKILADSALSGSQVGVCVTDATGQRLYDRNSETRFVPASNQKVLAVLFALDKLGPTFRGTTKIWKTSKFLFVETTGDPTLTLADLRRVRTQLKLTKPLPVLVRCPFAPELGPGWEWDDLPWYYAAQTSPLAFDHASFEVWASGSRIEPLPTELQVKIVRVPGGTRKVDFDPAKNTLTITGSLPSARTSLGRFAQAKPLQAVASALGGYLKSTSEPPPPSAPTVTLQGKTLAEAAKECLEKSDNVMAEQLMAMAGRAPNEWMTPAYPTLPERLKKGLAAAASLPLDGFRPVDGSGLSRHNQVSPDVMCRLLNWAQTKPFWSIWQEALAAPGEGTLKKRLKDSNFVGKTGTMDAVVSLCGYVTTKDGTRLTLSFFVNNNLAPASEVRAVQDRFVRALENGINPTRLLQEMRPGFQDRVSDQSRRASDGDRIR